ncbi:MAG: divalent-cation tolerance protein CutA [Candidatus Aminicenantes bacterium]|nr:divalent-cation tolerance protein CutA [Candidatus Aminicenantes bacterium]
MSNRENPSSNPNEFILVITTTNSLKEAKKIAKLLVKRNCAACVSISSPVLSVYKWRDKIENEDEFMLIIKTIGSSYSTVESLIRDQHSYELPEIIAVPLSEIEDSYSRWVLQNSDHLKS